MTERRNLTKFIAVFSAFVLVFSVLGVLPASADDESDKAALEEKIAALDDVIAENDEKIASLAGQIAEKESYAAELNSQIEALQSQIDALNQKIGMLDDEIAELQKEIDDKNAKITVIEADIQTALASIAECEQNINETYDILKTRLRSLYMNGSLTEIEVLLEADDFQTFLVNLELMNSISRHDTSIIDSIRDDISSLNEQRAVLDANKKSLEDAKVLVEEEKADIEAAQLEIQEDKATVVRSQDKIEDNWTAVQAIVSDLDAQSEVFEQLKAKAVAEQEAFSAELDAIIRQSGSSGSGAVSSAGFIWPLQYSNTYISCAYGNGHGGVDITMSGAQGKSISAVASGTVIISSYHYSYGNYIVIDHGDGLTTYYAHCSALYVSRGDSVSQGETIGLVGNTGNSFGPHIHFEVRVNGSRRDPMASQYLGGAMPGDAFYW